MVVHSWLATGCLLALCLAAPLQFAHGESPVADYERQIRPLLSDRCYTCHGPDAAERQAELRLDVRKHAVESAIVPGSADQSELIARVTSKDPDLRMPPAESKRKSLTEAEIDLLRSWIDAGAPYDKHWAYVPLKRAEAATDKSDLSVTIDQFIERQVRTAGLSPAPPADARTMVRRLSFDLTGLPPSPEMVAEFAAQPSEAHYQQLVDTLLESPQYGERMAMYWLDLVRYADTCGIHGDQHRDVWAYRDYVIDAFNDNMPFDQFTREQLAGDLLEHESLETRIASGYNRLLMTTQEGGAQPKEYTAKYAADRVRNVSSVWLGATMGCSECHDHKFDPYTQRDFYSFAAFFADVEETAVGPQPQTQFPTPEQESALAELDKQIALLSKNDNKQTEQGDELAGLEARKQAINDTVLSTLVTTAIEPRTMRVLQRGNWLDESGEVVLPAVPAFLGAIDSKPEQRLTRLDLANWLVDPSNPLVARVMVNRLWLLMFGKGLVATPDDFGAQGSTPTHRELLDWLALEFIDSGWDVKHMLRLMAESQTYRQTSRPIDRQRAIDPNNVYLARQRRYRLEAEMIRDNALAVSGLLVPKLGGPSVKPYQPVGYWDHLNFPPRTWQHDTGDAQYRRGLYTYWCRTFLHPSLLAFDATTREECAVQRPQSNTPLQALVLLNDPTYVESARVLAARILRHDAESFEKQLHYAYQQVLQRPPRALEVANLRSLYEKHLTEYEQSPSDAANLIQVGQAEVDENLEAPQLAAWTSVARVLLNLHESITRY